MDINALLAPLAGLLFGGALSWLASRWYYNRRYRNLVGAATDRAVEAFIRFVTEHIAYADSLTSALGTIDEVQRNLSTARTRVQDVRDHILNTDIELEALEPLRNIPQRLKGEDS